MQGHAERLERPGKCQPPRPAGLSLYSAHLPTHPKGSGSPPGTTGLSCPGPAPSCHPPVASSAAAPCVGAGEAAVLGPAQRVDRAPGFLCAGSGHLGARRAHLPRASATPERGARLRARRSCERGGSAGASSALGAGNRPPRRIPPNVAARPRPRSPGGAGPPGTGRGWRIGGGVPNINRAGSACRTGLGAGLDDGRGSWLK